MIKGISETNKFAGIECVNRSSQGRKRGAGFSVVASEVQKLSSETSRATENIESSLQGISSNIHTLLESMDHMKGSSSEQALLVTEFSEIVERLTSVKEMKEFMQHDVNRKNESKRIRFFDTLFSFVPVKAIIVCFSLYHI